MPNLSWQVCPANLPFLQFFSNFLCCLLRVSPSEFCYCSKFVWPNKFFETHEFVPPSFIVASLICLSKFVSCNARVVSLKFDVEAISLAK